MEGGGGGGRRGEGGEGGGGGRRGRERRREKERGSGREGDRDSISQAIQLCVCVRERVGDRESISVNAPCLILQVKSSLL